MDDRPRLCSIHAEDYLRRESVHIDVRRGNNKRMTDDKQQKTQCYNAVYKKINELLGSLLCLCCFQICEFVFIATVLENIFDHN